MIRKAFINSTCYAIPVLISLTLVAMGFEKRHSDEPGSDVHDYGFKMFIDYLCDEKDKSDGERTLYIGDKIFWALLMDPDKCYSRLSSDTSIFREFVENISTYALTNWNDSATGCYEQIRQVAICRLELMSWQISPEHMKMHELMLEALAAARARGID